MKITHGSPFSKATPRNVTTPVRRASGVSSPAKRARALGWFSIGLGLAEFLMPNAMARAIGQPGQAKLMRWCGVREIATGAGLLLAKDPTPWLWGRVGGDAFDLLTLASGTLPTMRSSASLQRTGIAVAAVAGVTALDVQCATALAAESAARAKRVEAYGRRRGLPLPAEEMRGAALADFHAPADMVTPKALRAFELQ